MLKSIQRSNKRDIKHDISVCVQKGEQRAVALEKKMKKINKKTRAALSAKVSTMISALRKRTAKSIYALNLETKSARAEMRKEIIYAVKGAAADADSVRRYTAALSQINKSLAHAKKHSNRRFGK